MRRQHDVNQVVIQKILGYCNDIEEHMNQINATYEVYLSNKMFRYSCDMCVLQIGELTKQLTSDFREQHPEILWHKIKGLRNVYVHEYEKVDYEQAWRTLIQSVPELKTQLEKILAAEAMNDGNRQHED